MGLELVRCYKCKGKGYIGTKVNPLVIILTLGWGATADTSEKCNACDGVGLFGYDDLESEK